jgi:hypothetical protein
MPASIAILLLSPDLMVSSRIAGLAAAIPATVEILGPAAPGPRGDPFAVIIVALQAGSRTAGALVARAKGFRDAQLASGGDRAAIVAFGLVQYALDGVPGETFGAHLYFSGITFMTIGYGDLVPVAPLPRFLAVLEGAVGISVIGMLIASWTKKIMYR